MGATADPGAVTAAELGEFIGISARAVADLGKRGIAVKAGRGAAAAIFMPRADLPGAAQPLPSARRGHRLGEKDGRKRPSSS